MISRRLGFVVLALTVVAAMLPGSHGTAHLLASKVILNEHKVENKDLTVQFSIYNVGTSTAQSVVLQDESFSPSEFSLVQGLFTVSWERIPMDSNVTHIVIVRPLADGVYNVSSARLTYTDDSHNTYEGITSSPGFIQVTPYQEFSRRHEHHLVDWLAFLAMSMPTIVFPFLLWYKSYSRYEKLKNKKE